MGYQEQYASNAADIYLKSADARARAKRQNGVILGNTLASLGQLPQVFQQQREHEQDRIAKQKQQATENDLRQAELDIRRQQLAQKDDPTIAAKHLLDLKLTQFEAAGRTLVDANADNWHARRPVLLSILGPEAASDLPEDYPGDDVIKAHVAEGQSVETQLKEKRQAIDDARKDAEEARKVAKDAEPKPKADYTIGNQRFSGETNAPIATATQKPATVPNVGTFDDYVTRTYGQNPTSAQILKARKDYMQADDRAAGAQAADITKLTPAGIDMAALNYRKTGLMPPLGMGDRTARQQILNRAAQLTPADIARIEAGGSDVAGNKADYKADSASLTKLKAQRDAIGAFENTAKKNIDLFLNSAKKVVDTGIPLLNTPTRWVLGAGGNADVAKYNAARQVAVSEIAKIVQNPNLTGQLSDSARHEIEVFNPSNATLRQTIAVMDLLKQDMANRKSSLDDQLKETRDRIGGGTPKSDEAPKPVTGRVGPYTYTVVKP